MNIAIETHDLAVSYGGVSALRDTNLAVTEGSVTALLGVNGSGKSSLLRALIGAIQPAQGTITIFGDDPAKARRAGAVGYLPQSESVDWTFPVSVTDVVTMGRFGHRRGITGRPSSDDRQAVRTALEMVDLSAVAERQIGQLSGGQRKRAFLARCIAQKARLLLLDEPFAGVDAVSQATITALLRDLARDGVTVLVSTHDVQALPKLADDVILLRNTPVFQGDVTTALKPANIARAFGVDLGTEDGHA